MTAHYVVLRHSHIAEPHFDVMFDIEPDAPLVTWRSPRWPIDRPIVIARLADHRREYLTYEGEISGNRGRVDRVAAGQCELDITEIRWRVTLADSAALFFIHEDDDHWRAIFEDQKIV